MSTTTSGRGTTKDPNDPMARLSSTARQAADTVGSVAGDVAARLPEAANTTRDALQEANRALQEANRVVHASSDEQLKVVTAASLGFAGGLLLAGANRMLVIAALVPAGLVASEYVQRRGAPTK
jgi:NaMN:DMB phosphoribosyltransferase